MPGVVTSAKVKVTDGSQASVAVATANKGVAGQLMVFGPGSVEMVGGVVSMTFMTWLAVEELPHASVAVHVRVTV